MPSITVADGGASVLHDHSLSAIDLSSRVSGAEGDPGPEPGGGADVRVWAPACRRMDLVRPDTSRVVPMEREPDGHFRVYDEACAAVDTLLVDQSCQNRILIDRANGHDQHAWSPGRL